ncbi:MAG: hypothetical protein FIB08_16710 [Candidatus Methanoperedens sp.]|nr:hypothetical protein [Candidatus Methanoperedens sp.]
MINLPFRTTLFIGSFFLIMGFYTIINPQLAKVSVLIIGLIGVIVYLVAVSLGIFDIIEKGSYSKYLDLEIIPDNNSNTIQKFINFLYSFIYILIFNFLISISSMFLLYKTDPFTNNSALLIGVSMTIIISIRFLTYFKNDIAKEIGKGFRYAMFPLGLAIFIWDFLISLHKPILDFIIDNNAIIIALVLILIVITSLEPLFDLLTKLINKYNKVIQNYNAKMGQLGEKWGDIVATKLFQKHPR